jgi:hypothetical protein
VYYCLQTLSGFLSGFRVGPRLCLCGLGRLQRAPTLSPTPPPSSYSPPLQVQQQNKPQVGHPTTQSSPVRSYGLTSRAHTYTHVGSSVRLFASSPPPWIQDIRPFPLSLPRPPPAHLEASFCPSTSFGWQSDRARYRRSPPRSELRSKPPPPSITSSPSSHHVLRDP